MQPSFVEHSKSVVFRENQLRVGGSLPATFYILTRLIFIYMSCVLRYRQQRCSFLLKFLPGLFGNF